MRLDAMGNDQLTDHLASTARDVASVGLCRDELARITSLIEGQTTLGESLSHWLAREQILLSFLYDGGASS